VPVPPMTPQQALESWQTSRETISAALDTIRASKTQIQAGFYAIKHAGEKFLSPDDLRARAKSSGQYRYGYRCA
jgi:hypothetical protein